MICSHMATTCPAAFETHHPHRSPNASTPPSEADWLHAHQTLSQLAQRRAQAEHEEGRALLAALRSAVHVHMGYGSFAEYVERLFGYSPRTTREKLRVAEALEELPALARALEAAELNWCAVREMTRVAVPETELAWLETSRSKTARQLEQLVATKLPGDHPDAPAHPEARRHILRFEVSADTFALFREAVAELRRIHGASLDDDAALYAMARQALGGPSEEGRASYQVALGVCSECGTARQQSSGDLIPVDRATSELAQCDAQHIGALPLTAANQNAAAPAAHVGRAPQRAKQTIPPALRRATLQRDQHKCRAPGCTNTLFLDVHHIVPRCEGGPNQLDNLVTLCGVHHRAAHRGQLLIDQPTPETARFRHADGTAYGHIPNPRQLAERTKTFAALRSLGFRESDARRVLDELDADTELRDASVERRLREAVQRLTKPCVVGGGRGGKLNGIQNEASSPLQSRSPIRPSLLRDAVLLHVDRELVDA